MAHQLTRYAAATGITVAALTSIFAAPAAADPTPAGEQTLPAVPEQYRSAITDAAQTCPQITAPLLGAIIGTESGFRADATSPAGATGPGQLMPETIKQFAKPGESPTDPVAGTHIAARALCSIADAVDKLAPDATSEGKRAYLLTTYNAGAGFASSLRNGTALADPVTAQILTESAAYTKRIINGTKQYEDSNTFPAKP